MLRAALACAATLGSVFGFQALCARTPYSSPAAHSRCCFQAHRDTNTGRRQKTGGKYQPNMAIFAAKGEGDLDSHENEADDEEGEAYGRRSLSWTRQYRRLLPYEKARKAVMDLGLRSKQEWDEYVEDGKVYHGPYLPNRPDEMYAQDWVSWDEFLGLMRPYEETRNIVQNVLQLQTMEEYTKFVSDNPGRAEGLRIPALPDVVYKEKGWINFEHFFGFNE